MTSVIFKASDDGPALDPIINNEDEGNVHPAYSPLSNIENIIWILLNISLQTFQLLVIGYFLLHTIRFIRRNGGKNGDRYSVGTLLLLCIGCIIRVIIIQVHDIITLAYYIDRVNKVKTDLTNWYNDNNIMFEHWVDDLHQLGIFIRNYAFLVNLARWYLIIK